MHVVSHVLSYVSSLAIAMHVVSHVLLYVSTYKYTNNAS
jgi:hypothetical protein